MQTIAHTQWEIRQRLARAVRECELYAQLNAAISDAPVSTEVVIRLCSIAVTIGSGPLAELILDAADQLCNEEVPHV